MAVRVTGLLLAAGGGRRAGGPKALRFDADGSSWLVRSVRVLTDGGCDPVLVVLGAGATAARSILDEHPWPVSAPQTVEAEDWSAGLGSSLRSGLRTVGATDAVAVLVHLVDLPDVGAAVVDRLLHPPPGPGSLARAVFGGRPGHPVLLGRDHLAGVLADLDGDAGARHYLERHAAYGVECGDLATGVDQDHPGPATHPGPGESEEVRR